MACAGSELHVMHSWEPNHRNSNSGFCFTGTLSGMSRAAAKVLVTKSGGLVRTSVTRNTDYLVVGRNGKTTGKYYDAKKKGVQILSEKEFIGITL